ncbi:MAG: RNA polymerase sigma-70 factor [Candidatus Phocaeicola faecipullorum]|nr:RNA polymerase sigma-70 factor [Candidatus Phocaeicola faecipullorum]
MFDIKSTNTEYEDKILIEGLKQGNTGIFNLVFTRFYSSLVLHATMHEIPEDEAEDLVQDFFFRLWLNRAKIDIHTSLKNYMFVSIKNSCNDYFRHKKAENNIKETLSLNNNGEPFNDRDFLVESELREIINIAINKLPEKCRKVFILYKFQNMKVDEIAEMENISKRTVETHLGKAYKILREELKAYLPAILVTIIINSIFGQHL